MGPWISSFSKKATALGRGLNHQLVAGWRHFVMIKICRFRKLWPNQVPVVRPKMLSRKSAARRFLHRNTYGGSKRLPKRAAFAHIPRCCPPLTADFKLLGNGSPIEVIKRSHVPCREVNMAKVYPQVHKEAIPTGHLPEGKVEIGFRMDKYEVRRQRLIWLRDNLCQGKAAYLAERIGRDSSYVSRMFYAEGKKGKKRIADDMIELIEKSFQLDPGWLSRPSPPSFDEIATDAHVETSVAGKPQPSTVALKTDVYIPLLAAKGSMGEGELVYEGDQIIDTMPLAKEWVARNIKAPPEALRVITGAGDSMEPTFRSGDLLLVDTSKTTVDIDGVYVLSAHNRLFIKRVRQRLSGEFEISSDNPTVKTVDVLNGSSQVTVHGRVVWAWNGRGM